MEDSSCVPRVLVVDDIDEIRVLIQRTLSGSGYQVDVAATLAQARAMDPAAYDAVLVDAGLGADRGVDLIEALRAENPAAAGRCLVMTGGAVDDIPAGVACLTKPFQAAELLDAVHALQQPRNSSAADPEARVSAGARVSPDSRNFADPASRPSVAMAPAARQAEGAGRAAAARQPSRADPVDPMDVHIEGPRAPSLCTSMGPAAGDGARVAADEPRMAGDGARAAGDGAPGTAGAQAWQLLGVIRRLRERERHELVDFLHDGPLQGLTAVALDLQMARSEAAVPAPRLEAALRELKTAAGSLRWLVDGHWTSLMARTTLADALRQRTEWLLAAPATVHADAGAATPTAAEIPVIVDVAELMLFGILPASPPMRADVAVRAEAGEIRIDLALTADRDEPPADHPSAVQAALGELASALGAAAHADVRDQPWQARLVLPRQSGHEGCVKINDLQALGTSTRGANVKYLDDHRSVALLEAAPDAMVCVTANGRIALVNAQTERLFGYNRAELVGQPIEVLVPHAVRGLHPQHRAEYTADPVPRPMGAGMELAGCRRDGSTFPAEISLSAIDTEEGILITAAVRDVTDSRRADARFLGLLEAAPDAMVCVNADGRIALVNAQTERLFGYRRMELVGQPVEMLVPDAVQAVHPRLRAGYMADPTPRPMGAGRELSGRRRDGSMFPAEISLSTIDTDEGILVTAAVRDVTERLEAQAERERLKSQAERDRLEAQLHQSQRLESLGQLAGGVAHDFNNLLGVISNYAAFVSEEAAKEPAQVQWQAVRDDIEQVEKAAERAAGLTHQLLAFARREVVQPRVLSLNDLITDLEQLLVRTLGEHVELVTKLAGDLGPVLADRGQLEQVLVNLAVNARDAMPAGGMLTLETTNTRVDETYATDRANLTPGRYVSLKVSDSGTGIPKEIIERVFEPFFTTKPKGEGSGLGLATVYGIIAQADGTVRIYSEPEMGTTLTVLLPITERPGGLAPPAAPEWESGGGEVVLIVEDEDAMREVARRMLERSGYQVLAVATGQEAVDIVTSQPASVDVLLTDVIMPKMLGKEVADRIRIVSPDVRVVFMSGYTQGLLSAQGALESGVNLIEKPFSKTALLAKLREVLAPPR